MRCLDIAASPDTRQNSSFIVLAGGERRPIVERRTVKVPITLCMYPIQIMVFLKNPYRIGAIADRYRIGVTQPFLFHRNPIIQQINALYYFGL